MDLIGYREFAYQLKHLRQVKHVTLNPHGEGVVRIHMVPPRLGLDKSVPSTIILNGQDILPINLSWAILLSAFIDEISVFDGKEVSESDLKTAVNNTYKKVRKVYQKLDEKTAKDDLWTIIATLDDIAAGRPPEVEIGTVTIGEYAKRMKAPHRMDLMVSSLSKNGTWNCNNKCLHCYAAGQKLADSKELSTGEWKKIISKCREAGIPQLTFTGGEPTLRSDLTELVEYSKWFITRLNTNGVLLTEKLCRELYEASLDSVQITLYSGDRGIHNLLVGTENWELTVKGIKNAVGAGLNVSVNTPLCALNRNYTETLKLIKDLGVKYVTCSGLILTGNAQKEESVSTQLSADELIAVLKEAFEYCSEKSIDIGFTSPGWLSEERLREIGFKSIPTCGACLSNMAVAPDGAVVPCQSWLSEASLGNMLTDKWSGIWNGTQCRKIRDISSKMEGKCQLRKDGGGAR